MFTKILKMDVLKSSSVYGSLSQLITYATEYPYVTVACGASALGLLVLHQTRSRNLPPGPQGLPFIGSSRLLATKPFPELLSDLQKQYGDVFCLWLGGNRYWVILNGYDAIKEAYVDRGNEFMDRQLGPIWKYVDFVDGIFSEPYNETYKANRKFCAQALRTHGFSKARLDVILPDEWQQIVPALDACTKQGMDQEKHFRWAATNAIRGVLFDKRLPHGDNELDEFGSAAIKFLTTMMAGESNQYLPDWINKHIESNSIRDDAKQCLEHISGLIEVMVLEHEKTFDADNIRDFVDDCIKHGILKNEGLRHLSHMCVAFMADAITTTSSMMMFIIMYLMHYPQYQERMRTEINDVVGATASGVSLGQKEALPFTEAFVNEVFRVVTPVTTSVPNRPQKDTTFRGYNIPKSFDVLVNIEGVHMNPKYFPKPHEFNPGNFLKDGKLKRVDEYFPFGIGRRRCMGEQLVKSELFYFTANLVQRYRVEAVNDVLPDKTPQDTSLARMHIPFNAVFINI